MKYTSCMSEREDEWEKERKRGCILLTPFDRDHRICSLSSCQSSDTSYIWIYVYIHIYILFDQRRHGKMSPCIAMLEGKFQLWAKCFIHHTSVSNRGPIVSQATPPPTAVSRVLSHDRPYIYIYIYTCVRARKCVCCYLNLDAVVESMCGVLERMESTLIFLKWCRFKGGPYVHVMVSASKVMI